MEHNPRIPRRDAIKTLGAAGAGALLGLGWNEGTAAQADRVVVTGRPVRVAAEAISGHTIRVSVLPLDRMATSAIERDGSLTRSTWEKFAGGRGPGATIAQQSAAGASTLEALTIEVTARDGRVAQRLRIDARTGAITFPLGDGPVLGLGEGGPQFDRRGMVDTMRSGQGAYRLRTHGGRVPVPWLIGTSGWALFVHQPFGSFDLSGGSAGSANDAGSARSAGGAGSANAAGVAKGRFTPGVPTGPGGGAQPGDAGAALPIDLFVVASRDPHVVMAEWARLTGLPELPPLWSFGYQQSHRTLGSRDEVIGIAKTFREKKLPCDAVIYI